MVFSGVVNIKDLSCKQTFSLFYLNSVYWILCFSLPQAWDLGYGFDMGVLYKSGWLVFFGSIGTAAALVYFLS